MSNEPETIESLRAEVARLQRLFKRSIEPTFGAFGQDHETGLVSCSVTDAAGVSRFLMGTLAGMLEGKGGGSRAPNYVQIGAWHPEIGRIECIIQRVGKLTPHEARGQAETALARAVSLLAQHSIPWDGPTTFLPTPPPEDEIGPPVNEGTPWCRIDVRAQPNDLRCLRCEARQTMPERATGTVLEGMIRTFASDHAECQEGDAETLKGA